MTIIMPPPQSKVPATNPVISGNTAAAWSQKCKAYIYFLRNAGVQEYVVTGFMLFIKPLNYPYSFPLGCFSPGVARATHLPPSDPLILQPCPLTSNNSVFLFHSTHHSLLPTTFNLSILPPRYSLSLWTHPYCLSLASFRDWPYSKTTIGVWQC